MSKPEKFISFPCKIFSDKSIEIEHAEKSVRSRKCQPEAKLVIDKILIKIMDVVDDFLPCTAKQDLISNVNLLSKVSYEIDAYFIDKAHKIAGEAS
jgi:hypothetical protein